MRHLMSPLDLSVEELAKVLDLANDIEKNPEKYAHDASGRKSFRIFQRKLKLCRKGRKCGRYCAYCVLLCRYLCYASSKRRCAVSCVYGI